MTIKTSSDLTRNAELALINLLSALNAPVTASAISNVKSKDSYPSLECITAVLDEWKIENLAVSLKVEQLFEIPLPAIVHLNRHHGYFIVVHNISNDEIQYFDSQKGMTRQGLKDFAREWTGIVLLTEVTDKSGELNFKETQQIESIRNKSQLISSALLLGALAIGFTRLGLFDSLIYSLKIVGLILSLILFRKQWQSSRFLNSFCNIGRNFNCDVVLNSNVLKLFGVFAISEISLCYFAGCLATIIILNLSNLPTTSILFPLASVGILFVFISLYYQSLVIGKWCSLCVVLAAVLVLDFLLEFHFFKADLISIDSILTGFVCFSLVSAIWLCFRWPIIDNVSLNVAEKRLTKFISSRPVFDALHAVSGLNEISNFEFEIETNSQKSSLQIVVVSDLLCVSCARAHLLLTELVASDDNINIVYRFLVSKDRLTPNDLDSLKVILHIRINEGNASALIALNEFYASKLMGSGDWRKKYKNPDLSQPKVQQLLIEHANWCASSGITKTPTLFINGKPLVEEYDIPDLKYHLRALLRRTV